MKTLIRMVMMLGLILPLKALGNDVQVSGRTATITLDGFMMSCAEPAIYVFESNAWRPAHRNLPRKGNYFLDGQFVGYGWCDLLVCNPIQAPIQIELTEYARIGNQPLPTKDNNPSSANKEYPAYKRIPLKGKIKVEVEYFVDGNCKNRQTFSKVLMLE